MLRYIFIILTSLFALCNANAQIFYKIEGNGLQKPSWLFGTHHLAPLSVLDSLRVAHEALDNADIIVGEIDMVSDRIGMGTALQQFMTAPPDSTLSKVISPDKWNKIDQLFRKYAPMQGLSLEMFENMRPMVVIAMIDVGIVKDGLEGYTADEQLDTYFQEEALLNEKPIVGLETIEEQGYILYQHLPISIQASTLEELADNPEQIVEEAAIMNKAYLSQDINTLLEKTRESEKDKVFYDALLNKRNSAWLEKIPSIISKGSAFIGVGALHLPGENGLVEGLRLKGYTVTPIFF